MIIYITRHGQPDTSAVTRHGDPVLSDLGRIQAKKLGIYLKSIGFKGKIYSSPYIRTMETADIIAGISGNFVYPEPALRECASGSMEKFSGLTPEEIQLKYKNVSSVNQLPYPWWKTEPEKSSRRGVWPEVDRRVGMFLEKISEKEKKDVLLVGHGASVMACFNHFTGKNKPQIDVSHIWNCGLSAFKINTGKNALFYNYSGHLKPSETTSNTLTAEQILKG